MFNDLILEQMELSQRFLDLAIQQMGDDDKKQTTEYLLNAQASLSQAIQLRKRTIHKGEE